MIIANQRLSVEGSGGSRNGYIRADVDARQVTLFIVSGYWGIRSMGKLANSDHVYVAYLKELKNYLATLQ